MKIKKNGFYLIKDEFFRKINDPSLPLQKNGRPMYYCIEDKNNKSIFWLIPMTTKIDKVNRIISQEGGEDKCKIYVINSSDKNSAFNIQDIFPIKENYIEREYTKNGIHYLVKNKGLIEKVEKRAKDIINLKMLKKEIQKKNLSDFIVKKVENGLIYVGESAGSAIMSPDIEYVSECDDKAFAPELKNTKGLNLLPFYPVPHYQSEPYKESCDRLVQKYKDKLHLVPFNNIQAITVEGDDYNLVTLQKI